MSDINGTGIGLQGRPIANIAPLSGQVLAWNASSDAWEPTASSSGFTTAGDLLESGGGGSLNWTPIDPSVAWLSDDFMSSNGLLSGASWGQLGWKAELISSGSVGYYHGEANHPGIIRLSTSNNFFDGANLHLGDGSWANRQPIANLASQSGWEFIFVFRPASNFAAEMMSVGFGNVVKVCRANICSGTHDAGA